MFSNNVEPYAETVGVDLVHITLQAISRLHQCQIRTKNNFFFNVAKAFYNDIEKSTTYCMNIEKESTQTMIFKELNHILKILWHVCVSEVATSQEEDYEDLSNSLLSSFFLLAKKCLDQVIHSFKERCYCFMYLCL
jgi:isoleucyl-tRNA synthetase